jgi:hypothetical protein
VIRREKLGNGLRITFTDQSNRYFGDYYRVCVAATIECDLADLPADNAEQAALRDLAMETFGATLCVSRRLERMGVPTADVKTVLAELIEDYLGHASGYLCRPGYPQQLLAAELRARGLSPRHA